MTSRVSEIKKTASKKGTINTTTLKPLPLTEHPSDSNLAIGPDATDRIPRVQEASNKTSKTQTTVTKAPANSTPGKRMYPLVPPTLPTDEWFACNLSTSNSQTPERQSGRPTRSQKSRLYLLTIQTETHLHYGKTLK
jgi:hypothetical protein